MNLHELVSQLIIDTKGTVAGGLLSLPSADSSLGAFLPELCICATMVLMLLLRLFEFSRRIDSFFVMLLGSGFALYLAAPWDALAAVVQDADAVPRMEIFTGMLVYDSMTVFFRMFLVAFAFWSLGKT